MPRIDKILNQNAGKHRDKSTYICSTPQPILPPMDTGWDPLAYTVMTTKAPTVLIRVSQAVSKMFGKKMH